VQQAFGFGARVITHCEVTSLVTQEGELPAQVSARDHLSGQELQFVAPLVINATGAWIDGMRNRAQVGDQVVQNSKGIHLIVDHIAQSPLIMSTVAKGKVFFVIPIDSERTLVGTTDTSIQGNPDDVNPDGKEVMELLQQLFYFFPYLKQGPNLLEAIESYKQVHVRDVYWGIRPLLFQKGSTLEATREHRLIKDKTRFWSLPGVKLTAARAAGYEAAIQAWGFLRPQVAIPPVIWDPLPGGEFKNFERFVEDAEKRFKLEDNSEKLIRYLVSQYGTRYVEVLQWAQRESYFSERIVPEEPWIYAQAAYAVHEEMVLTLNDLLWRRTKWAHYRDLPPEAVRRLAETLGQYLSWTAEEIEAQIDQYCAELKKHRLP
jgi:glycerol-3-phosphate dehydrogenase